MASLLLAIRVWIVRLLFRLNERAEQSQEPTVPEPAFMKTIPSPSRAGSVRLLFYTPSTYDQRGKHPLVVNFHGGGLTVGTLTMDARFIATLSAIDSSPVVVSVDYGLAPENSFPAAVQDAAAAILWLATEGPAEYGLDPSRIVLTGFSGGGTLVLAAPMWLASRRRNDADASADSAPCAKSLLTRLPHPIRGVIAIYPGVDFRLAREPPKSRFARFMAGTWDKAYYDRSPRHSPFVSPAAADDELLRAGLPKQVALYPVANDELKDQGEDFRKRLIALEKQLHGDTEPAAIHAFDKYPIKKGDAAGWQKRQAWYKRIAHTAEFMLSGEL